MKIAINLEELDGDIEIDLFKFNKLSKTIKIKADWLLEDFKIEYKDE